MVEISTQTKELDQKASRTLSEAGTMTITTSESYEGAGAFLRAVKGLQKEIDDTFKPIIDAAHKAHKEALAAKKKHSEPLEKAEKQVKQKVSAYLILKEQERRLEERRLQEEARKRAEEEQLARAAEAEQDDDHEAAEVILNEKTEVMPVVAQKTVPKVLGISQRSSWKYEIEDVGKIPREHMIPNQVSIGAAVRSMKGQCRIPGVKVWEEKTVGVRG